MYNETRRAAWAEIDLRALVSNYHTLRSLAPDSAVIAAVKADAYGHNSIKTSWELIKAGAEYLGVATLDEIVTLREAGIRTPIVLLSATPRGNIKDILDLKAIPVISSLTDASLLSDMAGAFAPGESLDIFLAIETGMGRLGILFDGPGAESVAKIARLPHIRIAGIFSHLSAADDDDPSFTLDQIDYFDRIVSSLAGMDIRPDIRTIANSAGIMRYPQAHYEAVRPGIALYGIYPAPNMDDGTVNLRPVMSVRANIVLVRKVPAGFPVSYGHTFYTERESLIGVIPLGYSDGLPRVISGKGRVIVNGVYAPLVGTISMDQAMVDLTDVPGVKEYDEVIIMGSDGELIITADEIAELSGTISYEVTTRFGQRLPKVYKYSDVGPACQQG
ncbi:MAG: alanine racemase [Clostridiales Family XIII bacterium]|jgi:alanine racemase|nr:alanine racemase [Clostridiales Family XIII bacterium]